MDYLEALDGLKEAPLLEELVYGAFFKTKKEFDVSTPEGKQAFLESLEDVEKDL